MIKPTLNEEVLNFFESISKYFQCKTEIIEGLNFQNSKNPEYLTWNIFEFDLQKSAYRKNGNKFMFEGQGLYFEIAANLIVGFKKTGRNKFEFIEQYSPTVFRITKLKFFYKY